MSLGYNIRDDNKVRWFKKKSTKNKDESAAGGVRTKGGTRTKYLIILIKIESSVSRRETFVSVVEHRPFVVSVNARNFPSYVPAVTVIRNGRFAAAQNGVFLLITSIYTKKRNNTYRLALPSVCSF